MHQILNNYFVKLVKISSCKIIFVKQLFLPKYLPLRKHLIKNHLNLLCFRFNVQGEIKYLAEAQELIRPERNTLTVDFRDVESYKSELATTIQEEYYRSMIFLVFSKTCYCVVFKYPYNK